MCGMADLAIVVELLLSSCTNDNCSMLSSEGVLGLDHGGSHGFCSHRIGGQI